jgi:SAM-dependent methyltransferase
MASYSQRFWDDLFGRPDSADRCGSIRGDLAVALTASARYFGPLDGKLLVDLGCGDGASSLFFASRGARVVSLDQSEVAIESLRRFCGSHGITSISAFAADAFSIAAFGPADFIFGSLILHHLEPFREFVPCLKRALKPEGRAFFLENNSASAVLRWFRSHVVGRFGVPKYGDSDEFPLTVAEVRELGTQFALRQVFPELSFFRLIPIYLLRRHFTAPFEALDRIAYHIRPLRKYSYRQHLYLENAQVESRFEQA